MTIARRYLYESADAVRLDALTAGSWAPLAELARTIAREERYHRMHIDGWLARLARADGEPRDRLIAALTTLGPDAGTVFTPLPGEAALVGEGILAAPMSELETRWRAAIEPVAARPWTARPARDRRSGDRPDPPRQRLHGAPRHVHLRPAQRPGCDVVTALDLTAIREAIGAVPDPELPVVSIGDLGMIHRVDIEGDVVRVSLLPTFLGCPAAEMIQAAVDRSGSTAWARPATVTMSHAVPWTSDRITAAGRAALLAAGIAPPTEAADPPCPMCGSKRTVMDNAFGPTQCRSLHYCRDCRQPFESFRSLR